MSAIRNEPGMNIINQINAGLNDVRAILISIIDYSKNPDISDQVIYAGDRARYQLNAIITMIWQHQTGKSIPWSERKGMIEEEFDEG